MEGCEGGCGTGELGTVIADREERMRGMGSRIEYVCHWCGFHGDARDERELAMGMYLARGTGLARLRFMVHGLLLSTH